MTQVEIRQKALQQAKEETKKWRQLADADEVQMEGIIVKFKQEIKKLKQKQEEELRKEKEEEELEQHFDTEESSEYYLYYQDDDDTHSTVIGISLPSTGTSNPNPTPNDPTIYLRRFVTSLRQTGFTGNIIIGLEVSAENNGHDGQKDHQNNNNNNNNSSTWSYKASDELIAFLHQHNVIIKNLIPVSCTFDFAKNNQKCYHPYSHIKREWSYFPIARDWLVSCETCLGPVALASIKDTIFQRNPFGKGMPIIQRLHLYELHPDLMAKDTSAGVLLKACHDIDIDKVNRYSLKSRDDDEYLNQTDDAIQHRYMSRYRALSAGTAVGPRDDIIDYLGAIHSAMKEWMHRSQCHFEHSTSDDGMAIVNHLRLQKRLPFRTRILAHRAGIVNNAGYDGKIAYESHLHLWRFRGLSDEEANSIVYEGAKGMGWIEKEYYLTDVDGNFIDRYLQKSAIIYDYSAFGPPFVNWFDKKLNLTAWTDDKKSAIDVSGDEEIKKQSFEEKEKRKVIDGNTITSGIDNGEKVPASNVPQANNVEEQDPMYYKDNERKST